MASVCVLLPTLNEEDSVLGTIEAVRKALPEADIVVIDGLSTDRTAALAEGAGARVLIEKRKGKGFAVKTAFDSLDSDYLLMIDVDMTYPVDMLPEFLDALKGCDVVMGSRFRGKVEDGAMSPVNNLGNHGLTIAASVLFLHGTSDLCTGMWGFSRRAYKGMALHGGGFEIESSLFAQAVKKGLRLREIPIPYRKREGESKVRVSDGVKILLNLIRERISA